MYSLGIDVGSSSVKVTIYDYQDGKVKGSAHYPKQEMTMVAKHAGWAEQEPDWWWEAFQAAYKLAARAALVDTRQIRYIGIAYQMHGLVCLDKNHKPLRPAIIWCDSRAVQIGQDALENLGTDYCFNHLLNSPGNFTASKLAWVKANEPEIYQKIHHVCLPGDYIAFKLTGELSTTISGISEGVFYDFKAQNVSASLLDYFGLPESILPALRSSFEEHGTISGAITRELNLPATAKVTYKAGDQPNNAFSLNVLEPGEIAATAGTSGVVYGVTDQLFIDPSQRVNSFAHVNYSKKQPRIGVLLCINGTGIANSWVHKLTQAKDYVSMNKAADEIGMASKGLQFFPFGNGAERMLGNAAPGGSLLGINFNVHSPAHLYRAVQEGIVYSFIYGMEAFKENNIPLKVIRAGRANMFLSPLFGKLMATLSNAPIELYDTDGALGAARGALVGSQQFGLEEVFDKLNRLSVYEPDLSVQSVYKVFYGAWKKDLKRILEKYH